MNDDETPAARQPKWRPAFSGRKLFVGTTVLLALVVVAMLLAWKPWQACKQNCTVQVTGEATLKAEPDEYVFVPNYQFRKSEDAKALETATKKSEEVTAALKGLGVADNNIKSNLNGYDEYLREGVQSTVYTVVLTVTVNDKALAQKVQDYIVTTSPTGSVSPQASFSDAKRKELERQARDEATKDAAAKAEQNARNLGFKVGSVKEISDGSGFGITPFEGKYAQMAVDDSGQGLGLQPGENELRYTVNVTFFVN